MWSLGYSFTKGNTIDGFTGNGLDNFQRLFSDPAVHEALWFTLKSELPGCSAVEPGGVTSRRP